MINIRWLRIALGGGGDMPPTEQSTNIRTWYLVRAPCS